VRQTSTSRLDSWGPIALALAVGLVLVVILSPWSSEAAFPGQNGKIAFDAPRPTCCTTENLTINPDSSGRAAVTGSPVDDERPSWSPDGTRIVFERPDPAAPQQDTIWVINADGSGATQLTFATDPVPANNARDDGEAAFSGDGTKIVFARWAPGFVEREIWTMNADGTGQAVLTGDADTNSEFNPAFSPNSALVAYESEMAGGPEHAIWTINSNGTGATNITPVNNTIDAIEPNFAPDGSRIAFAHCASPGFCFPHRIAVINTTGGAITDLTTPPGGLTEDLYPAWSPSGTLIAFHREISDPDTESRSSNIFTVPATGGGASQVSFGNQDRHADWQPVFNSSPPASGGGVAGAVEKPGKCQRVSVTIHGSRGNDLINGTPGRDVIHGLRGNDLIYGLDGNDRLCGGRGRDKLFGGNGDDVLFGGHHADYLSGGLGKDFLYGGTPRAPIKLIADRCQGGDGEDQFENCQKTN
jgi:Tol biopolymer transport system component